MSRAKVREDSPGTWEARTTPPVRMAHGWPTGGPGTAMPAQNPPHGEVRETRTNGEVGGTAKRRKRSAAGWHEGVLARA
jgi:hypothetical protein